MTREPPHPRPTLSTPSARPSSPAPRVEVRWDGRLLDVVALSGRRTAASLGAAGALLLRARNGGRVHAQSPFGNAVLAGAEPVHLGPLTLTLLDDGAPERAPESYGALDHRLVNIWMVAAAVQVCVVSAMLLAPESAGDGRGAGLRADELPRILRMPASTAARTGPAVYVQHGKRRSEAERPHERTSGENGRPAARARVAHAPKSTTSFQRALRALSDVQPEPGILRRTVGDLARIAAQAPQLGAGFGGLLPRDLLPPPGAGTGSVGLSGDRLSDALVSQIRARVVEEDLLLPPKEERALPIAPVRELAFADPLALDEDARIWVSSAVEERKSSIRSCYEAWGLAANPRLEGRLVVSFVLKPDGRVEAAEVEAGDDLEGVARCVVHRIDEWYLGSGLVDEPTRLSFPFKLRPRGVEPDGDPADAAATALE